MWAPCYCSLRGLQCLLFPSSAEIRDWSSRIREGLLRAEHEVDQDNGDAGDGPDGVMVVVMMMVMVIMLVIVVMVAMIVMVVMVIVVMVMWW